MVDRLVELAQLTARWGARMNLTGHRGAEEILDNLVLDALALWSAVRRIRPSRPDDLVVDLGSGAGYPGIPIAIMEPRTVVQLVEARKRRHHFQREVRRRLRLQNLEPRLGRIEVLTPAAADIVIAQAVAKIDQVIDLALPWTRPGSLLVVPGGARPHDPEHVAGIGRSGVSRYVGGGQRARSLWWGIRDVDPRTR